MEVRGWLRAVLGRAGRVEEVVPISNLGSTSADGEARGQEQPLSRVQQLLSGLPVCPAPGVGVSLLTKTALQTLTCSAGLDLFASKLAPTKSCARR